MPRSQPTAYARHQEKLRKEAKAKERHKGARRQVAAAGGAICGATKRGGGKCHHAAGWGTAHPGTGPCRLHLGNTPSHVAAAATGELRTLLGKPMKGIDPYRALMTCIEIRAGEVQWLTLKMEELNEKDWVEQTMFGKQFNMYARERQASMNALARYAQMAISLNISERAVKLAEAQGEMLAKVLNGIKRELGLTPEQLERWPLVVRRQLMLADGATPESLPELPEAIAA